MILTTNLFFFLMHQLAETFLLLVYMIQATYKQGCALILKCRKIKETSIITKAEGGTKPEKICECIDK